MNHHARLFTAVAIACLLALAACKDRHEPLKPTVIHLGITAPSV